MEVRSSGVVLGGSESRAGAGLLCRSVVVGADRIRNNGDMKGTVVY